MTTTGTRTLTEELWDAGAPVYRQILEHPFLAELASGELAPDKFGYYVIQDSLYLGEYARTLSIVAGRAPDAGTTALFAGHASQAIATEMGVHTELLADLGIRATGPDAPADGPSPTTTAYTSYLLAATRDGTFAEGVAAVLPCYWIYQKVGAEMARASSPNPVYARWIDTYAAPEFEEAVRAVLDVAERLDVTGNERERMKERYRTASRYEWMFWDAAYRKETWPV